MSRLKFETLDAHKSIERHVDVFRDDFQLPDYRRLLKGFLSFYRVYEPELSMLAGMSELEIPLRCQKRIWLEEDLRVLTRDGTPAETSTTSPPSRFSSISGALGSLYVVEGSTLGGQVISRRLSASLRLNSYDGLRFFTGYGKDTGLMWAKLGSSLRARVRTENDIAEAVAGAKATFAYMEEHLAQAV